MSLHVNIAQPGTDLSDLVARAEAGEEVVLSRDGVAVATITIVRPADPPAPVEKPFKKAWGAWAHLNLNIPDDLFLKPDPAVEEMIAKWDRGEWY